AGEKRGASKQECEASWWADQRLGSPTGPDFQRPRMPDALELLKPRRSVKPIELAGPGPTASEIETLLKIASRVPDHGKLAPWRFILFEGDARATAGEAIV